MLFRFIPSQGPRILARAAMLCPSPRIPPWSLAELCRESSDCSDGVTAENPTTATGRTQYNKVVESE